MAPLTWLRAQERQTQLELLAEYGSLEALATRLGCSASALRPIYMGQPRPPLDWTEDQTLFLFEKYRSVRLVAYMMKATESMVRKRVEELGLEITDLIDYSFGANSNSKGRRAELEFAALRQGFITQDLNLTKGSQANYDFDDTGLGKVNVKSSRQYRYRAQTRKGSPEFWKISTAGWEAADTLACMCYDPKMTTLVGVFLIKAPAAAHSKSLTLTAAQLIRPDALQTGDLSY